MPSFGTTLAKIAALVGGAVVGTMLARWVDELIVSKAKIRSEADRIYYERGLAPLSERRENEERGNRQSDPPPRPE